MSRYFFYFIVFLATFIIYVTYNIIITLESESNLTKKKSWIQIMLYKVVYHVLI
jgi:predicted permease